MKVRASVKPICDKCKVIKRKGFDGPGGRELLFDTLLNLETAHQ